MWKSRGTEGEERRGTKRGREGEGLRIEKTKKKMD